MDPSTASTAQHMVRLIGETAELEITVLSTTEKKGTSELINPVLKHFALRFSIFFPAKTRVTHFVTPHLQSFHAQLMFLAHFLRSI